MLSLGAAGAGLVSTNGAGCESTNGDGVGWESTNGAGRVFCCWCASCVFLIASRVFWTALSLSEAYGAGEGAEKVERIDGACCSLLIWFSALIFSRVS